MVLIQFDIAGERQVSRMLSRVTDKVENLRPFLGAVADHLREISEEQFDTQGGRSGGWRPLSPAYAAAKARRYGNKPILQRTGRLMESLTGPGGDHIEDIIGGDALRFGTGVPYAIFHQVGGRRLPQRKILDLTEEDRQWIMKELQRYLFTDIGEV